MYNEKVLEQKLDYIHENPIAEKWSLADVHENYHYSSARFYLLNIDDCLPAGQAGKFIPHYTEHM